MALFKLSFIFQTIVILHDNNVQVALAGVNGVDNFWFDFVEPRKEDDTRTCDMNKWDDGNGGGWKNSGNYSQLQTYFEVCRNGLKQLRKDIAGRNGPVSKPQVWNYMCGVECPISDQFHLMAMDWTGCRCSDLSTKEDSPYYRVDGDFCLENSARLLCNILGECDHWDCDLEDFMCPSHEFRRRYFTGYGYGDCSAAFKQWAPAISVSVLALMAHYALRTFQLF